VPPPIDTIRSGAFSALLCKGVTRVRLDIAFIASRSGAHGLRFGVWRFRVSHAEMPPEIAPLAALLGLLFFLFFVSRNRFQIFRFEDLPAIHASHVVDAVSPVQKFGSLVLTSLHSEITTILV
jgi:hypothetical protein